MMNCEERTIKCNHCEKIFKKYQLNTHDKLCDEKIIICKYCKTKYKRINEINHSKDICFKEISAYCEIRDSMIKKLEAEKNLLQNQNNSMYDEQKKLKIEYDKKEEISNNNIKALEKDNRDLKIEVENLKSQINVLKNQTNTGDNCKGNSNKLKDIIYDLKKSNPKNDVYKVNGNSVIK